MASFKTDNIDCNIHKTTILVTRKNIDIRLILNTRNITFVLTQKMSNKKIP